MMPTFRNHFCAGKGEQQASMRRRVDAGLATEGHSQENGSVFFHATKEGCKAVGMGPAGIKRAFEE
ncbi:hypothetical protein HHL21_18000 [Massilia sp. RP-1-19]|uniref:Uncharacterized protein n=1 Tax=Massilia polaris TaxID=2728846 RepID=A0A848HM06_9BURK|nr:hypothetical protein [Massilia polaris]NML62936.1 hypothetical protein [Massilia polaris]